MIIAMTCRISPRLLKINSMSRHKLILSNHVLKISFSDLSIFLNQIFYFQIFIGDQFCVTLERIHAINMKIVHEKINQNLYIIVTVKSFFRILRSHLLLLMNIFRQGILLNLRVFNQQKLKNLKYRVFDILQTN
jgi:hypothetical protein